MWGKPSSIWAKAVDDGEARVASSLPLRSPEPVLAKPARAFPHPYKTYAIQEQFMTHVYDVATKGGVALLESPTGTVRGPLPHGHCAHAAVTDSAVNHWRAAYECAGKNIEPYLWIFTVADRHARCIGQRLTAGCRGDARHSACDKESGRCVPVACTLPPGASRGDAQLHVFFFFTLLFAGLRRTHCRGSGGAVLGC
ncbi:hypothetical protein EON66_09170 [archaeon]|nr:MAG: hypothetical protein EON66_09170 [archaeon]